MNVYGNMLARLPAKMRELGWCRAYAVTEYGPQNWWQVKQTAWGAELEPTSGEKAAVYGAAAAAFSADASCVGGYAFKWGAKCQVTPTWISLLNEYGATYASAGFGGALSGGEETPTVEEIARVWTGAYPKDRAPVLASLTLAGAPAAASVRLRAGDTAPARCEVRHPQGAALRFTWLVLPEGGKSGVKTRGEGSAWKDSMPPPVAGAVLSHDGAGSALVRVPPAGRYRLFVWVSDAHNKVATANIPFEATPGAPAEAQPAAGAMRGGDDATGKAPESLACIADGYTRDGKHARDCFASESSLATKCAQEPGSGYGRAAYFRFELPRLRSPPARALLRVFALGGDGGGRTLVHAHAVADAEWQEHTLCAATAPQHDASPLSTVRVAGYGAYQAFDVTPAVAEAARRGARGVSFALTNAGPSEKTNTWASRRAGPDTAPHIALTF